MVPPLLRALALVGLLLAAVGGGYALQSRTNGSGQVTYLLQTAEEACPCPPQPACPGPAACPAAPCSCATVHELTPEQAVQWQVQKHGFEEPAYREGAPDASASEAVVSVKRTGERNGQTLLSAPRASGSNGAPENDEAAFDPASSGSGPSASGSEEDDSGSSSLGSSSEEGGDSDSSSGPDSASDSSGSDSASDSSGSSSSKPSSPTAAKPAHVVKEEVEPSSSDDGDSESSSADDGEEAGGSDQAADEKDVFGRVLKRVLAEKKIDDKALAVQARISTTVLHSILDGDTAPTPPVVERLSGVLEVNLADLVEDEVSSSSSYGSWSGVDYEALAKAEDQFQKEKTASEQDAKDREVKTNEKAHAAAQAAAAAARATAAKKKAEADRLKEEAKKALAAKNEADHKLEMRRREGRTKFREREAELAEKAAERRQAEAKTKSDALIARTKEATAKARENKAKADAKEAATKKRAAEALRQEQGSKEGVAKANDRIKHLKNKEQRTKARMAEQKAKAVAAEKARALAAQRALEQKIKKQEEAAAKRLAASKIKEQDMKKRARASERAEKAQVKETKQKAAIAKARAKRESVDKKEAEQREKRNREQAGKQAQREKERQKRELQDKRISEQQEKWGKEVGIRVQGLGQRLQGNAAAGTKVFQNRKYLFHSAPEKTFGSTYIMPSMDKKVCPSQGGAYFSVGNSAWAFMCCSHGSHPTTDGWEPMAKQWPVRGHSGKPCQFFRRPMAPGEKLRACCDTNWASGVFLNAMSKAVSRLSREPTAAQVSAKGHNQVVQRSNPGTAQRVWRDRTYEFTQAPEGVFSNHYVFSAMERKRAAPCPREGGAFVRLKRTSYVYMGCGWRASPTTSGWERLDGEYTLARHSGRPVTWYKRVVLANQDFRACCDQSWTTGLFVSPDTVPKPEEDPPCSVPIGSGQLVMVNAGRYTQVWQGQKYTFNDAPLGVFGSEYVWGKLGGGVCPKGGGARFKARKNGVVFVGCGNGGKALNGRWVRLADSYTLNRHQGRPVTYYSRPVKKGETVVACCSSNWATGAFVTYPDWWDPPYWQRVDGDQRAISVTPKPAYKHWRSSLFIDSKRYSAGITVQRPLEFEKPVYKNQLHFVIHYYDDQRHGRDSRNDWVGLGRAGPSGTFKRDYVIGCYHTDDRYSSFPSWAPSMIRRSRGWHTFEFQVRPKKVIGLIDGIVVRSWPFAGNVAGLTVRGNMRSKAYWSPWELKEAADLTLAQRNELLDRSATLHFDQRRSAGAQKKGRWLDVSGYKNHGHLMYGLTIDDRGAFNNEGTVAGCLKVPADVPTQAPRRFFTAEVWFRPSSMLVTSGGGFLLAKPGMWYLELAEDGRIRVYCYGTKPAGYHYSNGRVDRRGAHHAAYVYDGEAHHIYIDGRLDRRIPAKGLPSQKGAKSEVGIGSYVRSARAYHWQGRVYNARFYNDMALSPHDVKDRYVYDARRFGARLPSRIEHTDRYLTLEFDNTNRRFDKSGRHILDQSGFGNDALVRGKAFFDDARALVVAQPHAFVYTPPTKATVPGRVFSIDAWFSAASVRTDSGGGTILAKRGAYYMQMAPGGRIRVHVAGLKPSLWLYSKAKCWPGQTAHVAFVYDGRVARIYVNGVLDTTRALSGVPSRHNKYGADVGALGPLGSKNRFRGKIFVVRFFRTLALTAADVKARVLKERQKFPGDSAPPAKYLQHSKGVFLPVRRKILQGPTLRHKGKYSMMFWIKIMGTSDRWTSVLHHGTKDSERAPAVFIYPGKTRLHIRSSTPGEWNFGLDPPHYLKLNKWTHVAFSHGGGEMRVWLNGVLAAEADAEDPKRGFQGATYAGSEWHDTAIAMMADVMYTPGCVNGFHVSQAIKAAKFPRGGLPPHLVAEKPMRQVRRGFYRMSIVKHMEFRGRHTRSVSFWIRPHGLQHGWGNILFKGAQDALRGFGIWFYPQSLRLHVRSGTHRSHNDGSDPPQHLAMHRWTHVAASHDSSFIKVWINGRMVVRKRIGFPRYKKGRMWLSNAWHRPAIAQIADVRWFDLPIAHEDAQALYGARGAFVKSVFPVTTLFRGTDRSRRNRIIAKVPWHQGAYTLSLWVRPRGRVSTWTNLIHFGDQDAWRRPSIFFFPGTTRLHVRSASWSKTNDGCDPGQHLALDQWTHVIVQHMARRMRVLFNMREVWNGAVAGPRDVRTADRVWLSNRHYIEATAQVADIRFAEAFLSNNELKALHSTRRVQFNRWPDGMTLVPKNRRTQRSKPLPLGTRMRASYGYTYTLWLRPEGVLEPWSNILHKGNKNTARQIGLWFYPGSTRLHVRSGVPGSWNWGVDGPDNWPLPIHRWTHVAVVHTYGRFEVYFNNRMVVRHTKAPQPTPTGGHLWLSDPWHWRALAMVSDVRYFDMPLNMAELKTVYRQRRFTNYAAPPTPMLRILGGPQLVRPGVRLHTLPNRHVDRLAHTGAYSLSFWIKPRGLRHTWANILRKGQHNNGGERRPGVWFYPRSTRLHVRSRIAGNHNWGADPPQHLSLFRWSHICVQHRQGRFRVWINGAMRVDVYARAPINWRSPMFVSEPGVWSAVAQIADMRYVAKWWVPKEVRRDYATRKFNQGVWPPQVLLRKGPFHARRAAHPEHPAKAHPVHPGGYTWTFWVRPEGVRKHWANIIHHGNSNTHRSIGVWFYPGTTRLHIRSSSHGHWNHGNDPRHELTPLVWTHVAVTHTYGSLRIYLNGALYNDQKLPHEPVNYNGRTWLSDQWHVAALVTMADVRFFRAPLSDAELRVVPRQRRPPNPRPTAIRTIWGSRGTQARQHRMISAVRTPHRGSYSVSFWVQPRGVQPHWASILHKGENNHQRNCGVWFYPGSTRLHIRSGTPRNWNDGHDLRHGLGMYSWNHIVVTHQHHRIRIYVNRRLTVSAGIQGPQYYHPGYRQRWWGSDPWHWPAMGQLADVRYSDRIVSQGEVNWLFAKRLVNFNQLPGQIAIYSRKAFRPKQNHIASMGGGVGHSHGITWSFWLYIHHPVGGWSNIFHHGNHNRHRSGAAWMFPGDTRLHFRSSSHGNWNSGLDSRKLPLRKWTHIVFTHSHRDMRLYIDGGQVPNGPRNFYHTGGFNYPINYGGKVWASDPWHRPAGVTVRDLRYWHMPLTPHEVKRLKAGQI